MINNLWVEKFRPQTLEGYVFKDANQRSQIESWIAEKDIPHLLFSGSPGTGKTTLAKILIHLLEIDQFDVLEINASRENSVDDMRTKITNFVSTMPYGLMKIVLLDEADYISPNAQAILRGLMEQFAGSSRFILTCNYPNKIIPAIHSRTQGFHVEKLEPIEFTIRLAEILAEKQIDFDEDILDTFVKANYPDLRKAINSIQQHSRTGILSLPENNESNSQDYKIDMVNLFKSGKIREGRQLLLNQFRPEEAEELIRWCYDNVNLFGKNDEQIDSAIIIIRKALVNSTLVADQEINISAMMAELTQLQGQ